MKFISNTYTCFDLKYESSSLFYLIHYILSNTLYNMGRDNVCTMISYWKLNVSILQVLSLSIFLYLSAKLM